jgi:AcrR family transcriptional regulator
MATPRKSPGKTARRTTGKTTRKTTSKPAKAPAKLARGRRATKKEATQQRIVQVALRLFEKKGFDATTTKQIAKGARVAEGTVFNYFPTKDDIALHFFEQEVDHAIEVVRSDRKLRKAALEEKLFVLIQSQIEFLAPYERFIGTALVSALNPSSRMAFSARSFELRARYLAFVEELITESVDPARAHKLSWLAPNAFWLFYIGVLLYWLHDTSEGKQSTLAFLDRSLRLGTALLQGRAG